LSTGFFGELHESPDSENYTHKKHNHEQDQKVEQSATHASERSMSVPHRQKLGPRGVGHAVLVHSLLEMSMWHGVASVDQVSSFPDKHHRHEKSDQTDSVEDSVELLSKPLTLGEDAQEHHHEGNESGGGSHDS